MLKGILTGLLSKESRDKGYELSEDEDFIYLYLDGNFIKTWTIKSGITIQGIEKAINDFSKGGYTDTVEDLNKEARFYDSYLERFIQEKLN